MAIDYQNIPFVPAKYFGNVDRKRVDLIVMHSMEASEKGDTAESCARYFANMPASKKASAHYCVDNNSIVQCVQTNDVANAAPGSNHNGIHIELAGYARQTAAEWLDEYSRAMLQNAANLCGLVLCPKWNIPIVYVSAGGLKAGRRGFTTHAQVSEAFRRSSHWDPGPGFPMADFLKLVQKAGNCPP
jgi:N-acetyl-anhydromuramyl-L-alanine amidase AmpD